MQGLILVFGLAFPGILSLSDCYFREPDDFVGGADDRRGWVWWLILAVPLCLVGIGYGIVLGYYFAVVRRNSPMRR